MTARGRFRMPALIDRVHRCARPGAGRDPGPAARRHDQARRERRHPRNRRPLAVCGGRRRRRAFISGRSSRRTAPPPGRMLTDDAAVAEAAGIAPVVVAGSEENLKVTTAHDLAAAERLLAARLGDIRVGQGFDVHGFAPGDHVMICGIEIPHEQQPRRPFGCRCRAACADRRAARGDRRRRYRHALPAERSALARRRVATGSCVTPPISSAPGAAASPPWT